MNSRFLISCAKPTGFPEHNLPEFAFVGRSNVGKSSLINLITTTKGLAKTSSVPGKTQLINFFEMDRRWVLVDLPGIGYAKVSKKTREKWQHIISQYLLKREKLSHAFMLVDCRLQPQAIDLEFINWMGKHQISFSIVMTKCDKLSENQLKANLNVYSKELSKSWDPLPQFFFTSAQAKRGRDELLDFIGQVNSTEPI